MTSHNNHHPTDLDSGAADSVTASPKSEVHRSINDETTQQPRVRFMCSFGGKILPRPHDNQLRYVGGDTRIVAVHRHSTTFAALLHKLSKLAGTTNISIKYQLPNEDLDALITVTSDEDVENMMDEYDRFHQNNSHSAKASSSSRLRLFLFQNDSISRTSSISSLLGGSTKREHWFLDALNGGSGLERGRSEVSSILSEVPDYLFGLDNSDEQPRDPKSRARPAVAETISYSDPGSPAPVVSSPFCSTSSLLAPPGMPSIPELPPVRTKPDPIPVIEPKEAPVETFMESSHEPQVIQQYGYAGNPMWHYVQDPHYRGRTSKHGPFYYLPGTGPPDNSPVQIRAPYVQVQPYPAPPGQIPVGFHHQVSGMGQVIGGGLRPVAAVKTYTISGGVISDGMNQPVYYGVRNAYPGGGEELQVNGPEAKEGRVFQS